jgi:hypothetical protein
MPRIFSMATLGHTLKLAPEVHASAGFIALLFAPFSRGSRLTTFGSSSGMGGSAASDRKFQGNPQP